MEIIVSVSRTRDLDAKNVAAHELKTESFCFVVLSSRGLRLIVWPVTRLCDFCGFCFTWVFTITFSCGRLFCEYLEPKFSFKLV